MKIYYVRILLLFFPCWLLFYLIDNSCREVQCLNGGTCYENSADSSGSSYCLCKNGYTGQFCEIG